MQTRTISLIESITNVSVGFLVALCTQLVVFPAMGISVSVSDNLTISAIFTGVSVVRGYILRRLFNKLCLKKSGSI